jgi:hypothetical protein
MSDEQKPNPLILEKDVVKSPAPAPEPQPSK